jgi:hypothetical protein
MRALADVAGREAREAGALVEHVVEMVRGHELGVRLAVHVDELREQELDAVLTHVRVQLLAAGGHRERRMTIARGWIRDHSVSARHPSSSPSPHDRASPRISARAGQGNVRFGHGS